MDPRKPLEVHVLALDPGEKVGWARATVLEDGSWIDVQHGITGLKDMALAVAKGIEKYDVVIYETWRLRAAEARKFAGNDFQSSQFIGMVRLCAWLNPHVKLVSQGPNVMNTAEKTSPPGLREILDRMPKSHDDAHDGSALLHLWKWTWDNFVTDPALAKTAGPSLEKRTRVNGKVKTGAAPRGNRGRAQTRTDDD